MPDIDDYQKRLNWQPGINNTEEVIPAFAVIRFWGMLIQEATRPPVRMVAALKPDNYGAQWQHRVAWHRPTPPGELGYFARPTDSPILAAYDEDDGVPKAGELWGPIEDSWLMHKGVGGFRVVGFPFQGAANDGAVLVLFEPLLSLTADLTETLETDFAADANPVIGRLPDTDLSVTVNEVLGLQEPLGIGTRVRAEWDIEMGGWVVIAAACSTG